jgi:hypothetical protein
MRKLYVRTLRKIGGVLFNVAHKLMWTATNLSTKKDKK